MREELMKLLRSEEEARGGSADVRRLSLLVEEAEGEVASLARRLRSLRKIQEYVTQDAALMQPAHLRKRTLARGHGAGKQAVRVERDLKKALEILFERRERLTDALVDEMQQIEVCDEW